MGTLFEQPPRELNLVTEKDATSKLYEIKNFATIHGIGYDDAFKLFELLEYSRRTNLMVTAGDIQDEQISGLGELLIRYIDKIDFIARLLDQRM